MIYLPYKQSNEGDSMEIVISTKYGREFDEMIEAAARICLNAEDCSVTVCSEDNIPHTLPDRLVVIYGSADYPKESIHKDLSSRMGGRYSPLPYPLSLYELERVLKASVSAVKPQSTKSSLRFDKTSGKVTKRGKSAFLTPKEGELFTILYERAGKPVSREELREKLWSGTEGTNAPDVYVSYLRRKLAPVMGEGAVINVRGAGYILKDD